MRPIAAAYPVRAVAGGGVEWVALEPKTVQHLAATIETKGLGHPLTSTLLDSIHAGGLLPWDLRNLGKMVLKPTAYLMWKDSWTQRLRGELARAAQQQPNPLAISSLERLKGSAAGLETPQQQAAVLTAREIRTTTQASLAAYNEIIREVEPTAPWTRIQQGPTETFTSFVDRLSVAVKNAPTLPAASKTAILVDCMKQQANAPTRRILATAPREAGVADLVKHVANVQRHEDLTQTAALLARAQPPTCFGCGKTGHIRQNCRNGRTGGRGQGGGQQCWICKRFGHTAKQCRKPGNGKGGRGRGGPLSPQTCYPAAMIRAVTPSRDGLKEHQPPEALAGSPGWPWS